MTTIAWWREQQALDRCAWTDSDGRQFSFETIVINEGSLPNAAWTVDRMLRRPQGFAGAAMRTALRFYDQSPISRQAVLWLRGNLIFLSGWCVARCNAEVRGFFARSWAEPPAPQSDTDAAFYTPPINLLPWFNPLSIQNVAALADQRPRLNVQFLGLAGFLW